MIFTERTIKIANNVCIIDNPVVLYRGDYNIEVRFTILNCPYRYGNRNSTNVIESTEASYGQLVIRTPGDKAPIFSDITATKRGAITFTITAEMIDEANEVGDYTFQIRLLDENKESRVTIPKVIDGIEIREPIALEDVSDTNEVEVAAAGYALTTSGGTTLDAFDTDGNYIKTTWATGDRITAPKLNKIEAGIDEINKKVASGGTGGNVDLSNYVTKGVGNASQIQFTDGETFQAKLEAGTLKGEKGDKGDKGDPGSTEASGVSIQDTANNFTSTNVEGALAELFQSVSSGKSLIASAITDKGVSTSNTATFQEMATNIGNISSTEGDTTQYSVTYNLSNVTSSNTATSVNAGDPYTTTLTANSGYQLNTPVVTVDGLDVTSKYYSNGVFTINNVFGDIVITADATEIIIGEGLTLNYTFNNETPGNGYGTISLLASSDGTAGTYTIQYADDNGALSNYDNICTLTTTNGVQADYNYFIKDQMIPKYATKIIAVKDNQTMAEFVIPEAKRFTSGNYGQHLYSFGAISDIHTGADTWDTDLQEAFTYLNEKESVLFTCASGDITDNGTQAQFENFKTLKDTYTPNTPFYATNGNHEWYNSSFSDDFWRTYIDNDRTCLFTQGNDVFIMFGNEGTGTNCFSAENKAWLETQLARYANCRVFVFNHYFINGTDNGNFNNYYSVNVLTTTNAPGQWMLGLLKQYPNMFYVTGHSHMKFIVQELCNTITIRNDWDGRETGYMVHLPSITCPRDVINGSFTGKLAAQSEGVVIDVYENCVLYRGRNFVDKKFIPIGQYLLPKAQGTLPIEIPCTGVTLDQTTLALNGTTNTATLVATVAPEGCTDSLSWTTNNDGVATVDNGVVTALSNGTATITATCGNYSATCQVTVSGMSNTVSTNVYQVNSSNSTTAVEENGSYNTTLTAADGCTINHVRITMGGEDITNTVYNADTGEVNVTNITGDVIINALGVTSTQTVCDLTASNFAIRTGNPVITTNEDGSITVKFTANKQQYYVTHTNITAGATVILYVEDVSYSLDLSDTLKAGLGFYAYGDSKNYTMTSGTRLKTPNASGQIEFNVSGSKYTNNGGQYPVSITFRNCKLIVG